MSEESKKDPWLSRREFLEKGAAAAAALCIPSLVGCSMDQIDEVLRQHFQELTPKDLQKVIKRIERQHTRKFGKTGTIDVTPAMKDVVFGYGLDISRCLGCRRCEYACVKENNQSRDPAVHWIRVLELNKEHGIDLPEADPYYCSTNSVHDRHASHGKDKPVLPTSVTLDARQQEILDNHESQYPLYKVDKAAAGVNEPECKVPRPGHFYIPIACQQCENPPCVKVCPVKATWKEPDGIVVIDYDWCIGCRYCMAACPYGARHFNWTEPNIPADELNPDMHYLGNRPRSRGVVEKCTFCIQRVRKGRYPACVEVCPVGARKFGNMLDPNSEIRYIMEHKRVFILKSELATKPRFFYFYGT
jgi:Fe-S-cluster-containing dehydrogenase component